MKKLLFFPLFFMLINAQAQSWVETIIVTNPGGLPANQAQLDKWDSEFLTGNKLEWSKIRGILYQFDDIVLRKNKIEGSVFLFDNWKNKGVFIVNQKKYNFSNINYHIERESFMSQMEGDSTFVFNMNNVSRVVINGRDFKNFYNVYKSKNKVYEVVYESKKISLLKGYLLKYIKASPNPMINRPMGRIKHIKKYFVLKNDKLIQIKLKKSKVLEIFDEAKRKQVAEFAKRQRLSFKKEKDLQKIFSFYVNLK